MKFFVYFGHLCRFVLFLFLRGGGWSDVHVQALHWIVEGKVSGGLSVHHKAIVEHAIATEHPWVSAIYEECKETGDVRGLVVRTVEAQKCDAIDTLECMRTPTER